MVGSDVSFDKAVGDVSSAVDLSFLIRVLDFLKIVLTTDLHSIEFYIEC